MEHLIQPIPGLQCCRIQSRWHCSAGKKDVCTVAHSRNFHTRHLSHATLSHTYIHTYLHTYIHTYVHAYYLFTYLLALSHAVFHIPLCHTQLCLPCRSFTTSFVFPSFPAPSPLQPLKLSIGRSWLVGLSGPLIYVSIRPPILSIDLSFIPIYRSIYLPTFLSTYLSIYLSI